MGEPIGVVLAGGAGRRLGGAKPEALLGGRPLAAWVADALGEVVGEVVLAARADSPLPALEIPVWSEPVDHPPHPLAGLAAALARSGGRGVLACPVDLPFVSASLLRALLAAPGGVAVADGQPLLGRFPVSAAGSLATAAVAGSRVREAIATLAPTIVAVEDAARVLCNVNTAEDLAAAEAMLGGG